METQAYHWEELKRYGLRELIRENFGEIPPEVMLAGRKRAPYQRVWTPLVTVWGMVLQRLAGKSSADVVSAFRAGVADGLDPQDRHAAPVSARMQSEQNAGYIQARERLPAGNDTPGEEQSCERRSSKPRPRVSAGMVMRCG